MASKSREASARESTGKRAVSHSVRATDPPVKQPPRIQPTAEQGLEMLKLIRPIDNKSYEFGLAQAIQVHLIESIKLCGLKKARESKIQDMVTTLCQHLTNREDEINRWIEFSDQIALAAAEKLEHLMQEYEAVCGSRDKAHDAADNAHKALMKIRSEVLSLKKEQIKSRENVVEIISTFPTMIREFGERLRHGLEYQSDQLRSEYKSEVCDAQEELALSHDIEKQRLEAVIGSLETTIYDEREKAQHLQRQLDCAAAESEKEKGKLLSAQAAVEKARSDLREANKKIVSLEELLEIEKEQKKKELDAKDEMMKAELDDIENRVKQSFKSLAEKKDKEIAKALARASSAEASAKAAEKLLSELKASFISPVTTAEATSES